MNEKQKLVKDTITYLKQLPPEEVVLRKLLTEVAPTFALREEPLDDAEAKKPSFKIESEIGLIYFGEDPKELEFMQNLAKAISQKIRTAELVNAHLIEKEKGWKNFLMSRTLKWIIAPKRSLRKSTELVPLYKEVPATQERFLSQIPLFFIEPIAEYLKTPALKKGLWEELCKTLK